jgi:hypothetical protein
MKLAKLISDVINPFVVTFAVVVLLAFETAAPAAALKWLAIAIGLSVVPVFITVWILVKLGRLDGLFANNRRQRLNLYWAVIFWSVVASVVLHLLGAPVLLLATFVAGLSAIVVFMGINQLWKISLHTAFITGAVVIFILIYGAWAALSAVLVPAVAWARIKQKNHSPAQAVCGMALAAVIVLVVFYLFGLAW